MHGMNHKSLKLTYLKLVQLMDKIIQANLILLHQKLDQQNHFKCLLVITMKMMKSSKDKIVSKLVK